MFAQQSAQTLDVFADAAGAGEDDADVGGGDIDAFIENLTCHDDVVLRRSGIAARSAGVRGSWFDA